MFERRYFIVAQSFHGTTLLSKLLNDHPGIISLGDTYPSNQLDQVCGCGQRVSQCEFWRRIAERVGAERYREQPHMLPDYPRIVGGRIDQVLYMALGPGMLRRITPRDARERFATDFQSFEAAVQDNAGRPEARVFVDGVKSISRVYALLAAGVRVDGVIHLYRDPHDYIGSAMKQKGRVWRVCLRRLLRYRLFHRLAARLRRFVPYRSITYEGLADNPEATVNALFDFVQVPGMDLDELVSEMGQRPWHFMGNASLFHFDGTMRRSRHELSRKEQAAVRLLAGRYSSHRLHLDQGGS